jgi:neutral ceramidase
MRFIILLSIFFSGYVNGQSVKEKIVDSSNSQPVQFGSVTKNTVDDSAFETGVITDFEGVFNLEKVKPGNYYTAQFIDYEATSISEIEVVQNKEPGWKAGVAKVNITPEEPMWMAGYGSRDHKSEGTLHDLWAKALVLEDASGKQAVLITSDLLGIPKNMSDHIRDELEEKYNLSRSEVMFNSSHTHSAPVLENALVDIYPMDSQGREQVKKYSRKLEDQIVNLVGEAIKSMEPVELFSENGVARFQVNRRNNNASTLHKQSDLNGPNDYAVPVLKVVDKKGDLLAITFGYACHPTVLNGYQWSGDYPGFAQIELEKAYPGTTALFFQGAGADQNPLPRRTVPLARQYGRTLAAAVQRVLEEDMRKLAPELSTAYSEVELPLSEPPTEQELAKMAEEYSGYQKRWAERLHKEVKNGKKLETEYPSYPLQVWKVGDQVLMSLGGELVIHYAIELKKLFGHDIFVLGYSNDVMAYIPSSRILREGGYEGESSQMVYGLPTKWAAGIDALIINQMSALAEEAGVVKAQ